MITQGLLTVKLEVIKFTYMGKTGFKSQLQTI